MESRKQAFSLGTVAFETWSPTLFFSFQTLIFSFVKWVLVKVEENKMNNVEHIAHSKGSINVKRVFPSAIQTSCSTFSN